MIKKEKGITLVALIITVVIMILLAGVVSTNGGQAMRYANFQNFTKNLTLVETKVDVIHEKIKSNSESYLTIGKKITDLSNEKQEDIKKVINLTSNNSLVGFKYFNQIELAKLELNDLDLEVIINFETREVISVYGFYYEDTTYYTVKQTK